MRHILLLALTLILFTANTAFADNADQCPNRKGFEAEEAIPNIKQWSDFYTFYKNYAACDDGSIGEGFSDSAAKMLANHWDQVGAFLALANKDRGFKDFIIGHIDETDDLNDITRIISNAHSMCPAGAKNLCKALEVQATHPDISGWLGLYAIKQKTDDGGHAIYLPEDDVFVMGDLTGERKDDLAVAFTLGGISGANDWSRYVAVFTKMPVNDGEEYEYCCMYKIGGKGIASDKQMQIKNHEILVSGKAFVPGIDAECCPSKPMLLRLKIQGLSLVEISDH